MIETIYIERDVAKHPRVQAICERYAHARQVFCERYGEVFNRKNQSFRLQKRQPSLILAAKHKRFVLSAPDGYGVGGTHNYYFSHMLNCVYDCRYCFLQGMYRSAHYVVFVNYEDFVEEMVSVLGPLRADAWFFSGYDCDSLALEPVTGFVEYLLTAFPRQSNAWLELRTKSTQIRGLLDTDPHPNWVVALSVSPESVVRTLEHKTASLARRLDAMEKLQQSGWKVGLRFDPLIYFDAFRDEYEALFKRVFERLDVNRLHSVSLGTFRMPEGFFNNMVKLYPFEPLFAGPLERNDGMIAYRDTLETEMRDMCTKMLLKYIPSDIFYPCT